MLICGGALLTAPSNSLLSLLKKTADSTFTFEDSSEPVSNQALLQAREDRTTPQADGPSTKSASGAPTAEASGKGGLEVSVLCRWLPLG